MLDRNQLFYSVLAMNALFASLAWCLARPNWASILSVVVFAALWPFANNSFEGRTIVVLSHTHGITTHDLLSVLAVVVAAVQVVRIWAQKS
jgi:hypothetical protein